MAHSLVFGGVAEDSGYSVGEFLIGNDAAGFVVAHNRAGAAVWRDDGGNPAGEGFPELTTLPKVSVCEG